MHPKYLPAALLALLPVLAACSDSASPEQAAQKSKDDLPGDDGIVLFPGPGTSKEPTTGEGEDPDSASGGGKNVTGGDRSSSGRDNPPVPEPGTLFIVGSGLAGFAALRRRRRKGRGADVSA